jgi:FtsP/CotA-like multicopper oxidase with cupredoxin domain
MFDDAIHVDLHTPLPNKLPLSRRRFLQVGGLCVGVLGLAAGMLASCSSRTPAAQPAAPSTAFVPDVEIVLRAVKATQPVLPGAETAVWRYIGELRKGDAAALQPVTDSYLGPTIRVRQGQKVRVELRNELDEATNIHWHGLIVPETMDGHPRDVAPAGSNYVYEFEVRNRAGTYWYHPHPHGRTGAQVNQGLAGLFIVEDEAEAGLALPTGAQDVALVLQDRTFDADNQFVYLSSGMMDEMMGFLGERPLINGQPDFLLPVATSAYHLRILNGSNSRIYKLAWSNGMPLTVIGADGGLLDAPLTKEAVTLAPAQRVELWADFRDLPVGSEVKLISLPFTGVEAGMMDMMAQVPNGVALELMTVRVGLQTEAAEVESLGLPERLVPLERLAGLSETAAAPVRTFALGMDSGQNWTINGRTFQMDEVAGDEQVSMGALEIWEFVNEMDPAEMGMSAPMMGHGDHMQQGADSTDSSGMVMMDFMAHPIHIHGVQFQVLARQVLDAYRTGWESVQPGYVDEGWLDTVLVMPGERVKLLVRFDGYPGMYVYHCHNLEHEDQGMMRNYLVEL